MKPKRSVAGWIVIFIAILLSLGVLAFNIASNSGPKVESTAEENVEDEMAAIDEAIVDDETLVEDTTFVESEELLAENVVKVSLWDKIKAFFVKDEDSDLDEPIPEEEQPSLEEEIVASEGETEVVTEVVESEPVDVPEEIVQDEVIWHFYNLDLQDDDDKLNDYNFGENPIYENISEDKVRQAIKGKKPKDTIPIEQLIEMFKPEELRDNQLQRMHDDPKLGAADMAWYDSIAGTRYLGTFYSAAKEQWDVAMNDAADHWIENEEDYNRTLDAFEKNLMSMDVRIEYRESGLTDQMYMDPYTPSGIPDIIVMKTTNHDGWFVVYSKTIKETKKIEVAYRIDCGYQPTNVEKIMKIKPKPNPNNQTGGQDPKPQKKQETVTPPPTNPTPNNPVPTSGGDPDPDPDPNPDPGPDPDPNPDPGPDPEPQPEPKPEPQPEPKPEPQPEPKPEPQPEPKPEPQPEPEDPPKDSTQGTQVISNDDPGPGPDTNNPSNPTTSTAEQPTNSNNMTQEEYKEAIQELKEVNETQKEGGDDNTPSYTPPATTKETSGGQTITVVPTEDNNGDTGNGGDNIDVYTNTDTSSVANDEFGGTWDGPPD